MTTHSLVCEMIDSGNAIELALQVEAIEQTQNAMLDEKHKFAHRVTSRLLMCVAGQLRLAKSSSDIDSDAVLSVWRKLGYPGIELRYLEKAIARKNSDRILNG